ncbi:NTPase (NACHT family) [Candidatus Magnetobacterium bavaricum]|uniref:NTPase (NACHT family) n=1 Tax=Candidatus Magnetobacterium bavaricum TaxID=29290 RepID=A0A0F3GR30_9BACT|nr:NTPase (NACHT family) [Candidatus Magnetobacterium bavaricum]
MVCKDWDDYKPTNDLNLQKLKEVIKSGRAIAFVGAGCSMPLGYPSWAGLIQKMLDEIVSIKPAAKSMVEKLRQEDDLLVVADECKSLMGPEYYVFIGRQFEPKTKDGKKHTPEHEAIVTLPFHNYITSNYDACLDNAYCLTTLGRESATCFTYNNRQKLADYCNPNNESTKMIFHIHGRYDTPEDIVLTENEYKDVYHEGFISSLRSIIMTHPVVFIGSGVNDLDFLTIMRFIDNVFKKFQDKHYAIIPCPDNGYAENEVRRLTIRYNIVPVFYENPDGSHSRRVEMLRGILSYCKDAAGKKPEKVEISATSKEDELTKYKVKLNAELSNLRILDMSRPLNLLDIYIKICLREKVDRIVPEGDDRVDGLHMAGAAPDELGIPRLKTEYVSKSMFIEEALKGQKKIVILGDPGAGKTTLLKHITLQLADKGVEGIGKIPIFVPLRDYISKFTLDLLEYLDADLSRRYGFNNARKHLEEEFEVGNVAIFFDGLDEVSGGSQDETGDNYNKIVDVINDIATRYNTCHIAVTCRKAGWMGRIKESFSIFEVLDFTYADITCFVEKWFHGDAEKARELNREFGRRTGVRSLFGNPLLLSFVCILYGKFRTFQERRVTLYEKCVNVLLNDWDESRGIERRGQFGQDKKRLLLQDIAYRFFIAGKRYFKRDELIRAIEECLPVLYLKSEDATAILKEISANNGLLKEQAEGWYGFIHLTVQEYFAACEIYQRRDYKPAIDSSFKPWWEEVILLLAGIGDSTELIKGLFEKTDNIFNHNLMLAGRCLAERPTLKGDVKLRETVLKKLKDIVGKSNNWSKRKQAVDVLAENGEFYFLLALLRDEKTGIGLRCHIADALGKFADSSIVADFMPILLDEKTDNGFRQRIADALGNIADSSIVANLKPILLDKKTDNSVRISIVSALGKFADSSIVADLKPILLDEKTDYWLRGSIAETLGNIADSSIVADLISSIGDVRSDIRISVIQVIDKLGNTREHCMGLLKLRSKYGYSADLNSALYKVSRRAGVTIDQDGKIIDI